MPCRVAVQIKINEKICKTLSKCLVHYKCSTNGAHYCTFPELMNNIARESEEGQRRWDTRHPFLQLTDRWLFRSNNHYHRAWGKTRVRVSTADEMNT